MLRAIVTAALLAAPLCVTAADSAKAASAGADDKAKTPQQEKSAKTAKQAKMKACNKEASDKSLKGDYRKKFMSDCLKGPATS